MPLRSTTDLQGSLLAPINLRNVFLKPPDFPNVNEASSVSQTRKPLSQTSSLAPPRWFGYLVLWSFSPLFFCSFGCLVVWSLSHLVVWSLGCLVTRTFVRLEVVLFNCFWAARVSKGDLGGAYEPL